MNSLIIIHNVFYDVHLRILKSNMNKNQDQSDTNIVISV